MDLVSNVDLFTEVNIFVKQDIFTSECDKFVHENAAHCHNMGAKALESS